MTKLLLSEPNINLSLTNYDNKTCYEAYGDPLTYDEASNLIEKQALYGK